MQKKKILDSIPGTSAVPRFSIEQAWMVLGLKILFALCMQTTASAQFNDPNSVRRSLPKVPGTTSQFEVEERPDRLIIAHSGQAVAELGFMMKPTLNSTRYFKSL